MGPLNYSAALSVNEGLELDWTFYGLTFRIDVLGFLQSAVHV
jgi:hypothetical protein